MVKTGRAHYFHDRMYTYIKYIFIFIFIYICLYICNLEFCYPKKHEHCHILREHLTEGLCNGAIYKVKIMEKLEAVGEHPEML